MVLSLSQSQYYCFEELTKEWSVCSDKLKKWLMSGKLQPHLWLPILSAYARRQSQDISMGIAPSLEHFEGFVPLTHHHCQRLFRRGKLTLREFSSHCGKHHYQLPDSADDIRIRIGDLLVLEQERKRFEQINGLNSSARPSPTHSPSKKRDFRHLTIEGKSYHFGDMQSKILETLYQASLDGQPWQNGKQLLQQVGSQSFTLSNVFKHKPVWKRIIQSDGCGYYRLDRSGWDANG